MRVVWVTPYPPDRNGGGGQIRQANLLLAVAKISAVTLISGGQGGDELVSNAAERVVWLDGGDPWHRNRTSLRRVDDLWTLLASRLPREARVARTLCQAVVPVLAPLEADVVLVEYLALAPLVRIRGLRSLRDRARWLLTLHNLPSRMAEHEIGMMPKRRQRLLLEKEGRLAARLERASVDAYDAVIVTSDADRKALGDRRSVHVLGNGVDLDRYRPAPRPDGPPRVIFTGALYTGPNEDAAHWFCQDILPMVRAHVAGVRVDLVGARPGPSVRRLADIDGVEVHDDVEDVRPYLARAIVAIVPIRIGSGTRLKALEAWASSRPVVGTTLGLEGLGCTSGQEALIADSAVDFAGAVVKLLLDRPLARALGERGRRLVERRYGWERISRDLCELVARPETRQGARG